MAIRTVASGTITGQLFTPTGEPLSGGMVYLFNTTVGPPPDHVRYWRAPDLKQTLDTEGKFKLVVPEGEYYLGGTKKASGRIIGPPAEGDYYFISTGADNLPLIYRITSSAPTTLGAGAKAELFKGSTVNYGEGITAIEGIVTDVEGKPVAGAFALAFVSAMRGARPLFISDATGKDGKFILRVHDGGTFFLKVRTRYGGGAPVFGELFGMYGERQPIPVSIKRGERVKDIAIKVVSFFGRGAQQGGRGPGTPQIQPR